MGEAISLGELLEAHGAELDLSPWTGPVGLARELKQPRLQRPGLALASAGLSLEEGRLQILGPEEVGFLAGLASEARQRSLTACLGAAPAAVVVAAGASAPEGLLEEAMRSGVAVLGSGLGVEELVGRLGEILEEWLGACLSLHGVLVDVMGVGLLLQGSSGVGKSECALDLVLRGHRLVADDVVLVRRGGPREVFGASTSLLRHHMEIRGLGIINIKDLYGVSAVRDRKKIELMVELVEWRPGVEYDRLGLEDETHDLLGVSIPRLTLPVQTGRYTTTLVEVAARNLLLKRQGHHSAREFQARLQQAIGRVGEEDGG